MWALSESGVEFREVVYEDGTVQPWRQPELAPWEVPDRSELRPPHPEFAAQLREAARRRRERQRARSAARAFYDMLTTKDRTHRGRVDVRWNFSDDAFTMSWTEREGPCVSAPTRCGFGTMVLERMAESSLGGTVDLDYARSGLTWRLTCPAGNALEGR
jgi:hypothetical protein